MSVQWDNTSTILHHKKACESVRGQLLYSKFVEFDISVKVDRLIKVIQLKAIHIVVLQYT
jgi:hypothetical protein